MGLALEIARHETGALLSDWQSHSILVCCPFMTILIAGTIFGGNREAIWRGKDAFMGKVYELLQQGIPDMDQPIWGMLLKVRRDKDLLEP